MKIHLYDSKGTLSYNPYTLKYQGVGGAENAIINLSEAFAKRGHEVHVFNNCNIQNTIQGVNYHHFNNYFVGDNGNWGDDCDLFIGCDSFPYGSRKGTTIVNWVHRPSKKIEKFGNKIVCVSEWQKNLINDNRCIVIPNGIEDCFFIKNIQARPKTIIYAGYTGKGGMAVLPQIYNKVKIKHPEAKMIVCGGGGLWNIDDSKFLDIYKNLIDNGITYVGQVGSTLLSELMSKSSIFINPVGLHHKETFGLSLAQSMASGCIPVSSGEGNLGDLINENGFAIYGDINSDEWINEAVESIDNIFNMNENNLMIARSECFNQVRNYTWENSAVEFEKLCK